MNRGERQIREHTPPSAGSEHSSVRIAFYRSSFIDPHGFTLVELLVVISIVVLLMAILLPTLGRARKQAGAVACEAKLRQWGLAFQAYFNDSRHSLADMTRTQFWYYLLRPYCSDSNDLVLCPMATHYEVNPNDPHPILNPSIDGVGMGSKYTAWKRAFNILRSQNVGGNFFCGSYGINVRGYGWEKHPSEKPLLLDSVWEGVFIGPKGDTPPAFDGDLGPIGVAWVCIDRHQGSVNGVFLDGVVRKIGLKELWTFKWFDEYDTANRWTKAGGVQPEDWPGWMCGFRDY